VKSGPRLSWASRVTGEGHESQVGSVPARRGAARRGLPLGGGSRHLSASHIEATTSGSPARSRAAFSLALQEGDAVKAGQESHGRRHRSRPGVTRQASGPGRGRAALRLAGARPEDIAEAEAQMVSACADLWAERDLARMEDLRPGFARLVARRARTRRDVAQARVAAGEVVAPAASARARRRRTPPGPAWLPWRRASPRSSSRSRRGDHEPARRNRHREDRGAG
jgi:hypothetical protein